ncbi:MAG: hypothetical protein ACREAR_07070, partial [Nitrosotalea sp.]
MKTAHLLIIIIISGTTILLMLSASSQFNMHENQISKEDCMGGQYCSGATQLPSASLGNRTIAVSLKLYSNSTMPSVHYLWLRFFDESTNQTIQHVTFSLNVTKSSNSLLFDTFNAPAGIIILQVNGTSTPFNGTVLGDRESILGGWMQHNNREPVVVYAPVFNDPTAKYYLNIVMYTIDQDDNMFTTGTTPKFDFYLNSQDQNMILTIPYLSTKSNQVLSLQHGYPPFDTAYSNNPVIITQVELATPLQHGNQSGTDCTTYQNGTEICQSYTSPYNKDIHSPYYDIQCAFFGGTCQLMHQVENLDSQCDLLQEYPQGTQWIKIYNQMNFPIHLTHFGVTRILDDILHIQNMAPQYAGTYYVGNTNFTMSPHQTCSYGFIAGPIGSALEFPINDTSLAITYDYEDIHHMVATPFLTDSYNDSKTWQYNGTQWIFTDSV